MSLWQDGGTPVGRSSTVFRLMAFTAAAVVLAVVAVWNANQREQMQRDVRFPPATDANRFGTLVVGAALPGDADCAGRVRRHGVEIRPDNAPFNQAPPYTTPALPGYENFGRVTGAFTGTTDEIIQWASCKWGIDEDVVRAQAARESKWHQGLLGDFGDDPDSCLPEHPPGADGQSGRCPESVGIMQVSYPSFRGGIQGAAASTAYNLDLALAVWRTCYDGGEQWLDFVERGRSYVPGDLWGCVGRWYAGRWHTEQADKYIERVRRDLDLRIWETAGFVRDQV